MAFTHIGITSPGDMGQAVASTLKAAGFHVHAALDGRSGRTRALGLEAGLNDCGTLDRLVNTCDVILSVLNPGAAIDNAKAIAASIRRCGKSVLFVDCNAVAPETVRTIAAIIGEAGGGCLDAGIIGPPPRGKAGMRFYVSGPGAERLQCFHTGGIDVRVLGERIGDASAIKMCYASYTKGAVALGVEMYMAARRLGVDEALDRELQGSLAEPRNWIISRSTVMPPKAYRWVPEMLEIAKTFEDAGLTPRILQGAADMYGKIAETSLGRESPEETRAKARDGLSVINALADE
jgi:3-hydroxyisobutyrate dehydrogenase-like beta-hydroxyacid dehydrogenase